MSESYDADATGEPIADVLAREAEEAEAVRDAEEVQVPASNSAQSRQVGPWGCGCPSCLACTGNCPRCGQRDLDPELGLCPPCDAELAEEVE